jgi:regulator of sirC expression with transglutaminase-like and TPR domain
MKALLVIVLLSGACRRAPEPPLTRALLALGGSSPREQDAAAAALADLARQVETRLRAGEPPAQALAHGVYDDRGFVREVDDADPRFMRLPAVLAGHRGSCLGLGALFLALGERLGPAHGFSVAGVLVPGHFFVRVAGHNAELLRRGEEMPDAWYRQRYQIPEHDAPAYLRALTPAEVLAVFDYNTGNDLTAQGRFAEAASAYRRAAAAFPQMAEVQASLGRLCQLTGALADARAAYQAARAANPHLPGLDRNLSLVIEQMTGEPAN